MYRIGEFSQLGQVSTRMLRHYDKLGLLVPEEVDRWTGYRYYSPGQLSRLHQIIALKDLGFTLQEIGDLLQSGDNLSPAQLRGMLLLKQTEAQRDLHGAELRLRSVEARLRQLEQAGQVSPYEIIVKSVQPVPVASLRAVVPHISEMGYYCATHYHRLYDLLRQHRIRPLEPEITVYHALEYHEEDLEVETGIVIPAEHLQRPPVSTELSVRELPAHDLVAALIYEGSYSGLTDGVLALLGWLANHGHAPAGTMRELHLSGPAHIDGQVQSSAVIELQAPIRRLEQKP